MKKLLLCMFFTQFLTTFAMEQAQEDLESLLQDIDGKVGVCAINPDSNDEIVCNADEFFPMISTRKVILAGNILMKIREGTLSLNQEVPLTYKDLVPGTGIINENFQKEEKKIYTIQELLEVMMIHSDNTASDFLMRLAGGYEAINKDMEKYNIQAIRLGKTQNNETTNIATPRALTLILSDIYNACNNFFEPHSNIQWILSLMKRCETGKDRMPKYLPNATVYHTGSGATDICNDIGIIKEDSKTTIASILIKNSTQPMPQLEERIARIALQVHHSLHQKTKE